MIEEDSVQTVLEAEAEAVIPSANEPITDVPASDFRSEDLTETDGTDYAEIAASDLRELKAQFPELADVEDITELDNPIRYAGLRDLGLTPREAYLATSKRATQKDNRSHLSSAMPKGAGAPRGGMSREELYRAREIFGGMSDVEIQALYRKVNA